MNVPWVSELNNDKDQAEGERGEREHFPKQNYQNQQKTKTQKIDERSRMERRTENPCQPAWHAGDGGNLLIK